MTSTSQLTAPPPSTQGKLLVIDDNDDFRNMIKELLAPLGMEILTTGSPVKALEMFTREKENIKLVLLDYYMPQLDGPKTFEWLRKLNPTVKVLIVSGADELRLRQMQAQYKIDGYLRKPFRAQDAMMLIQRTLSQPSRA